MNDYVLSFGEMDRTRASVVGGKAAHLGELSRIDGIRVPPGFCVTTGAFQRVLAEVPPLDEHLEELSRLGPDDRGAIDDLSAEMRRTVEGVAIPDVVVAAITDALSRLGELAAYAVRSSAAGEDSPVASFAGLHDTYLNVVGEASVLQHVRRCWASLFTERAVTYRLRKGIDPRQVQMGVVVQQMAFPQVSGVLFTADPQTSNRTVATVEASFGLGEPLVSGVVNPDVFKVRARELVASTIATKRLARQASPSGGTQAVTIEPERQEQPTLTGAQVLRLVQLGRRIAAHFGEPQDIEWCLTDGDFQFVQTRPVTTLFPVPESGDDENHVYVSVGHGQMMTDAMTPLGLSFWQMTTPRPMVEAGGRMFVDVTQELASPASRTGLLDIMGRSDPLVRDALQTVLERGDFVPSRPDDPTAAAPLGSAPITIETDPDIVEELIARTEASIAGLRHDIRTKAGPALLDFIRADLQVLRQHLFDPESHQAVMAGMQATWWLNDHLQEWLGEKNAADALTQSVSHNITSEMGLALLDVADAIRPHADVVAFLELAQDDGFMDELPRFPGGQQARDAIAAWLDRYGMRCVGEIDITRPRWSERPTALLPLIIGNIRNFGPGEGPRRFEQGRQEAERKEQELLEALRATPDGERKAEETKRMIDRVRTFIGYREYPKYGIVRRYFVYKQALLEEAERLAQLEVLGEREDIFYLTFQELQDVVRTHRVDEELIRRRQEALRSFDALTPPRVLTSEGESLHGSYHRADVREGVLVGLPVSAGIVEGRARVILEMAEADLEPGDILVTTATDPSWSPLFVAITGLVTEVGGLMTHGAVIAREYGLVAVVGVPGATRLIQDGQRIRVNGTDGHVEILPDP